MSVDLEAEGLLAGAEDERSRESRRELIEALLEQGITVEELRAAVAGNRLVVLPAERALTREERYTVNDLARESGLEVEFLEQLQQALGLPRHGRDDRVLSDEDLDAARRARAFLDAGLPADGVLDVARVIGRAVESVAVASRQLVGTAMLRRGDTELEVARRFREAAGELVPQMGTLLEYQYRVRLREGLRREAAVPPSAIESGELPGATEVAVGFADLVGFTSLGERLPAEEMGRLAGELAGIARDVAEEPVTLVKTIGDAAMLVSTEAAPLVDALLALVDQAEQAGEDFPPIHAGAAHGAALSRAGDWYGRPVNLASRVAGAARPGSVLVESGLRDAVRRELGLEDDSDDEDGSDGDDEGAGKPKRSDGEDPYRWSRAGRRSLKGVDGRVRLYRVRRRAEKSGDEGD